MFKKNGLLCEMFCMFVMACNSVLLSLSKMCTVFYINKLPSLQSVEALEGLFSDFIRISTQSYEHPEED